MKKPGNWFTLQDIELTKLIHELNVWNSKQSISEYAHAKHYHEEIRPLVRLRYNLQTAWLADKYQPYREYVLRRFAMHANYMDFIKWEQTHPADCVCTNCIGHVG